MNLNVEEETPETNPASCDFSYGSWIRQHSAQANLFY